MSEIVEKVAKAIWNAEADWRVKNSTNAHNDEFKVGVIYGTETLVERQARAAIKATLEHMRGKISAEMNMSGKLADQLAAGFGEDWGTRISDIFRAMLSQALAEIEGE